MQTQNLKCRRIKTWPINMDKMSGESERERWKNYRKFHETKHLLRALIRVNQKMLRFLFHIDFFFRANDQSKFDVKWCIKGHIFMRYYLFLALLQILYVCVRKLDVHANYRTETFRFLFHLDDETSKFAEWKKGHFKPRFRCLPHHLIPLTMQWNKNSNNNNSIQQNYSAFFCPF